METAKKTSADMENQEKTGHKTENVQNKSENKPGSGGKTGSEGKNNRKKTEAVVNGRGLPISLKHGIAICNMIRGREIDSAIRILEEVLSFKRAVPMKGEIPHRKGKIMSGRYPVKACKEFIKLLKSLKANASANELETEKYIIFCKTDVASRPYRRFGRARFKRAHVQLKLTLPEKKIRKQGRQKE